MNDFTMGPSLLRPPLSREAGPKLSASDPITTEVKPTMDYSGRV